MKQKIYGHRGARGLYPENSIEGFEKVINMPIEGVELDIVVSKDNQLIVSHEPWMSHLNCIDPMGNLITTQNEMDHNIYKMNYDEILLYDCGQKRNPRFPFQELFLVRKPLLKGFFDLINSSAKKSFTVLLEIKSEPELYGKYQPLPMKFAQLMADFLKDNPIKADLIIQSFDPQILNAFHRLVQNYKIGLLVENTDNVEKNLSALDFKPDYYNVYHGQLNKQLVSEIESKGIKIITWTVNSAKERDRLLEIGIIDIITDYPDLFL